MTRPIGQLERGLAEITVQAHRSKRQRDKALVDGTLTEIEQQVHFPLSGTAFPAWGFTDEQVSWELPFVYAPSQRRVPFPVPHFVPGFEFTVPPLEVVVFQAHVVGWGVTQEGWFVGAVVRCQVAAPDTTGSVPFSAVAHLSFQGLATTAEGDEFQ